MNKSLPTESTDARAAGGDLTGVVVVIFGVGNLLTAGIMVFAPHLFCKGV